MACFSQLSVIGCRFSVNQQTSRPFLNPLRYSNRKPQVSTSDSDQRLSLLELQPCFTGGIGKGLNASVIKVAPAIEHDLGDALGFRLFRDRLADFLGRSQVAAGLFGALAFDSGSGNKSLALQVVDDLGVNVVRRAINAEARTL